MSASSENGSSSHSINMAESSPNAADHADIADIADGSAPPETGLMLDNSGIPKPKRLACMICRKRKLKCDGLRPSCSTCTRLGHPCAYDEQRRKSGPKRGYVKALEERLKQVETLLKSQDPSIAMSAKSSHNKGTANSMPHANAHAAARGGSGSTTHMGVIGEDSPWAYNGESPPPPPPQQQQQQQQQHQQHQQHQQQIPMHNAVPTNFTWEMIGLGLEEPLPPQKTIDELHQLYFEKVHPSVPMVHRYRYLAAMNLPPALRPPVCLRYAIWTLACSISDRYSNLMDLFYQRARKYVEADYMKGYGEHMVSVAHCQTHILLTIYEMKMMYFPRAWINTGSAVRLAQMIGLHRLDGVGLEVKQCLPPPKDWTEAEERRRTFWMAFCQDRYASLGTGWPMIIDERDILTNLPSSEEAFDMNRSEKSQTLQECMSPAGASKLSSFGGTVLVASLFGRNLNHLHRPDDDDPPDRDMNGSFWKRHRQMDNILLHTSLNLPPQLKLPGGLNNPNIIFTNMCIHTSTICLHQAAISRAEKHKMSTSASAESKMRCFTAANEIANIMRMASHMDLSAMHPFIAFCLYVSARVFVQYLKSKTEDAQTINSLTFLLSAMNALKRRSPLTESFILQLDMDSGTLTQKIPELKSVFPRASEHTEETYIRSGGPICDDPEGVKGILAYRGDCDFTETGEEDDNLPTGTTQAPSDAQGLAAAHTNGYAGQSQSWLPQEHKVPVLTPNSGSLYRRNTAGGPTLCGFGDGSVEDRDASGSPDDALSAGRTPNSSGGASDHRSLATTHGPMGHGTAGPDSFHASPISPQHSMISSHAGVEHNRGHHQPGLYPPSSGYSMADVASHHGLSMSSGWGGIGGQVQGSQPVCEGVLRALMTMGPMDAMDLSSWDPGNPR